jgi:hypothetical protein
MGEPADSHNPERVTGRLKSVGFTERATVFFFEECFPPDLTPERRVARTKVFDGRSVVSRTPLGWSDIDDFLTQSASDPDADFEDEWFGGVKVATALRSRSYGQHWEMEDVMGCKSFSCDDEGSESTCDDDDYAQTIRLMEALPCDADL